MPSGQHFLMKNTADEHAVLFDTIQNNMRSLLEAPVFPLKLIAAPSEMRVLCEFGNRPLKVADILVRLDEAPIGLQCIEQSLQGL